MNFSDREKQLIRAAFAWGQISQEEGYTLTDGEIEKSVLFRRLLAGRPPLAFPPPLRHGYPWYEIIEGRGRHTVNAAPAPLETSDGQQGENCILIEGSFWRVAETIRESEEYIVEWGNYPIQWRLERHWQVSYEMTQQLQSFRQANPSAELNFGQGKTAAGERDYGEFRIDSEQTVWLSEWHLCRIGLPGWVWVGTEEPTKTHPLTPLLQDNQGPLVLGTPQASTGPAWLRIEHADGDFRFLQLGESMAYRTLISVAATQANTLLHGVEGADLNILDWRDGSALRNYRVPAKLAPLEEFDLEQQDYQLVPENACGG